MIRLTAAACAAVVGLAACSTSAPSTTDAHVTFDGKPLTTKGTPTCVHFGDGLMFAAKLDSDGSVEASVNIKPQMAVQSVSASGVDGDRKYFWETTSTAGEAMTVTNSGGSVTISGKVHQINDYHVVKPIQIAAHCPGV